MSNQFITISCFLFFAAVFQERSSFAQGRVFYITKDQLVIDGLTDDIYPGDTLVLEAGQRREIHFRNLTGSKQQPIVIINATGKVVIHTNKAYGIFLDNSVHCKVTGTGGPDKYGIEIASTTNHGLVIAEFSSHCEADHIEIHHTAYAGIVAKTDPNCNRKDLRFFVMRNLSFHHNFIHDTFAEGFYVGYSWFPSRTFQCGEDSLLHPHEIQSVRIFNNILKNTGQEGIQLGTGTKDIKIYGNSIYNYGVNNMQWQNHGVQIGQGTTGDLFGNTIDTGPAEGISLFGGGNNNVFDNIIKNSGSSAIYQNDRNAVAGSSYRIYDNTIINASHKSIVLVSDFTEGNEIKNNLLFTDKPDSAISDEGKVKWKKEGNRILQNNTSLVNNISYNKEDVAFIPFLNADTAEMKTIFTPGQTHFAGYNKNVVVKLFDSSGVPLSTNIISAKRGKLSADFSKLPTGIYFVTTWLKGKRNGFFRIVRKS